MILGCRNFFPFVCRNWSFPQLESSIIDDRYLSKNYDTELSYLQLALPMACFSYSKRQSVTSTGSRATIDEKQEHDRPCWSVGFETGIQSVREEV